MENTWRLSFCISVTGGQIARCKGFRSDIGGWVIGFAFYGNSKRWNGGANTCGGINILRGYGECNTKNREL